MNMKTLLAMGCAALMSAALFAGCSGESAQDAEGGSQGEQSTEDKLDEGLEGEFTPRDGTMRVMLVTPDYMDPEWLAMAEAAQAEYKAAEAGGMELEFFWTAPQQADTAQEIADVRQSVDLGGDCIVITAGSDPAALSDAIREAKDTGAYIMYAGTPAQVPAAVTFIEDDYEAGYAAGEAMMQALADSGVTEGRIGIVTAQPDDENVQKRIDGFREALDGTSYETDELKEIQDAVQANAAAKSLIKADDVGVFGADSIATRGAATAAAVSTRSGTPIVCAGFDDTLDNLPLVRSGELLVFRTVSSEETGPQFIEYAMQLLKGEYETGSVETTPEPTEVPIDTPPAVIEPDEVQIEPPVAEEPGEVQVEQPVINTPVPTVAEEEQPAEQD